jgi:hypothetical protein
MSTIRRIGKRGKNGKIGKKKSKEENYATDGVEMQCGECLHPIVR